MIRRRPAKSFLADYPVNLDMLPPLSLQTALDEKQRIFSFRGRVSEAIRDISPTGGEVHTELGGIIKPYERNARITEIDYGSLNPEDEYEFTQEEVFQDITDNVEVPDVVIREKGIIRKIPSSLEDNEVFQGADKLYHELIASGNRTRKMRRMTNLPLKNPYYLIRGQLFDHKLVSSPGDPVLRRIKSVLKTNYILPNNDRGYWDLDLRSLLRALRRGKWWEDTGVPKRMVGSIDSGTFEGVVYQLETRPNLLVAV